MPTSSHRTGIELLTRTGELPVSLGEAKAYIRIPIDDTDEDSIIQLLLEGAVEAVEDFTCKSYVRSTYQQTVFGYFPELINLLRNPISAVTKFAAVDSVDVETVLSFRLRPGVMPAIVEHFGIPHGSDHVVIEYACGAAPAPAAVKVAILMAFAHFYENRASDAGASGLLPDKNELPKAVSHLLETHSIPWLA